MRKRVHWEDGCPPTHIYPKKNDAFDVLTTRDWDKVTCKTCLSMRNLLQLGKAVDSVVGE
jgi:hypothetical protein